MKKMIIIALIMVLTLSLVACGGNDKPSGDGGNNAATPPPSSSAPTQTPPSTTPESTTESVSRGGEPDLTTIEGFLSAFGLTEADLICANFSRLDIASQIIDTKEIREIGVLISQKLTDEDVKAWLDQILGKLGSLADEGSIQNALDDGEMTTEYIMSQSMYIGSGKYTYDGKSVSVLISVVPGFLDNEDPDEAMAACTLGLEFN